MNTKRTFTGLVLLLFLFIMSNSFATKLVKLSAVDQDYLVIHFKDGDVEFVDDGVGSTAFHGHEKVPNNSKAVYYGDPLDVLTAEDPATWTIRSEGDADFGAEGQSPLDVFRKTKVNGHSELGWNNSLGDYGDYEYEYTHEHFLYLKLPSSLKQGNTYTVEIETSVNSDVNSETFTFDIYQNKSEAVRVNVVGYTMENAENAADLYAWLGDGGARDYSNIEGNKVFLYNLDTEESTEVGLIAFGTSGGNDVGGYNLTQSDVWHIDFITPTSPGNYRLAVEGVGCSDDFRISNDVYKDPYRISVQGFFYMRIGQNNLDMEPVPRRPLYLPQTDPSNTNIYITSMHPYHTDWSTFSSGDVWDNPNDWKTYVKAGDPQNPNAWGGHSDALDWDRHLGHVSIIYDMLLPYVLSQGNLDDDKTGIAESGNGIPDILDEARNEVDFWLRLREGKGYSHGLTNPNSNNNLYQAANTAVAAWANALNASMLAECYRLAGLIDLKNTYRDSASVAFSYANELSDQMLDHTQNVGEATIRGRDFKMMAAAFLYNLTGDTKYEDVLQQEAVVNGTQSEITKKENFNQIYGVAAYLKCPRDIHYPDLYDNMKGAVIYQATEKEAKYINSRPSRRSTDNQTGYFKTIQNVHRTMIAHAVTENRTDKEFFRKALLLEADWGLGRNPLNIIQMTTASTPLENEKSIENIYTSGRDDGTPGLHPGHTPYLNTDNWYCGMTMGCPEKLFEHCYPDYAQWPAGEGYFNSRYVWAHGEFTPQQTMRGKMALYGYLYAEYLKNVRPEAHSPNDPYDKYYRVSGRTDTTINGGPVMYYAGSTIEAKFEGTSLKVSLTDIKSKEASNVGFIIDGAFYTKILDANSSQTFEVVSGLNDTIHNLTIVKMEDPGAGIFGLQFNGIELDANRGLLPPSELSGLSLEFFGDSFTAGVGGNCIDGGDCGDNNGYNSFAGVCGRILNAQVFNNGIGGLAVMDNTGWYQSQTTGLQTTYDKLNPSIENGNNYTEWDFDRFTPDVVVFGFGINDDFGAGAPFDEPEKWKSAYKMIIRDIVSEYGKGNTRIVIHPANIQNEAYTYAKEVSDELSAEGYHSHFYTFSFDINEHPDKEEHQLMGQELASFVDSIMNEPNKALYTLQASATAGNISMNPPGGEYTPGTQVTVETTVKTNYTFDTWQGDVVSESNPLTIDMDDNKTITASFYSDNTEERYLEKIIDDSDPVIEYSGNWDQLSSDLIYDNTESTNVCDQVSLSLTFEGNAINLIGRKSAFGAEDVVVKIDGEVFSRVSFHSDEMAYQQVIFSASGLSDGEHNLVIEHNECDEFIFVDAFIVNPGVKVATKAYTLEPDNIELFPNPVQDKLNVTLQNEINHGKYFIMSVDGAKIEDGVFHHFDFTINTEKLPNGSYILNAGDDNMRYIKMFVK